MDRGVWRHRSWQCCIFETWRLVLVVKSDPMVSLDFHSLLLLPSMKSVCLSHNGMFNRRVGIRKSILIWYAYIWYIFLPNKCSLQYSILGATNVSNGQHVGMPLLVRSGLTQNACYLPWADSAFTLALASKGARVLWTHTQIHLPPLSTVVSRHEQVMFPGMLTYHWSNPLDSEDTSLLYRSPGGSCWNLVSPNSNATVGIGFYKQAMKPHNS